MESFLSGQHAKAAMSFCLLISIVGSATLPPNAANPASGIPPPSTSTLSFENSTTLFPLLAIPYPKTPDGCFLPPTPKTRPLVPVLKADCYQAADNILDVLFPHTSPSRSLNFGRPRPSTQDKPPIDIILPQTSKYGSCRIYINVAQVGEEDTLELWNVYGAALDLVSRCAVGGKRSWGGVRSVGRLGVVQMVVAGRVEGDGTVGVE